jgi:uncharacterized membrane protein
MGLCGKRVVVGWICASCLRGCVYWGRCAQSNCLHSKLMNIVLQLSPVLLGLLGFLALIISIFLNKYNKLLFGSLGGLLIGLFIYKLIIYWQQSQSSLIEEHIQPYSIYPENWYGMQIIASVVCVFLLVGTVTHAALQSNTNAQQRKFILLVAFGIASINALILCFKGLSTAFVTFLPCAVIFYITYFEYSGSRTMSTRSDR